nr:MAG TPA: hypothetical protein [Caudoviricetes sp.]
MSFLIRSINKLIIVSTSSVEAFMSSPIFILKITILITFQ